MALIVDLGERGSGDSLPQPALQLAQRIGVFPGRFPMPRLNEPAGAGPGLDSNSEMTFAARRTAASALLRASAASALHRAVLRESLESPRADARLGR